MTVSQATKKSPKRPVLKADGGEDGKFKCIFCNRSYTHEHAFLIHLCENKRRYQAQDEKHVKLGFMVYRRFYEMNYPGKVSNSYDEFMRSKYYSAFTKFGRYLLNINAINPMGFAEFLMKTAVPLNKWESPIVYDTYVRELNKKESPDVAVERNILLMQQWAMDTGQHWTDFFRKVAPTLATMWIKSGRISPWVLYVASSSEKLFDRLSEEQLRMIQNCIDPKFWETKLELHKDDVNNIRQILDEAGI